MRVNWLRAKSRRDRWREENVLLRGELEWSWRFFLFQESTWRERGTFAIGGSRCYALKQVHIWKEFGESVAVVMKRFGIIPE